MSIIDVSANNNVLGTTCYY